MKYIVLLVSVAVSFICLPGLSYQDNCMWDGTCPEEKYNVNFCGNGYCEPFETKDSCIEDCGSILDLIIGKIESSSRDTGGAGGPFAGLQDSGIALMLSFLVLIIVIVTLGIILIAVYDKVVGSVEKEIVVGGQ